MHISYHLFLIFLLPFILSHQSNPACRARPSYAAMFFLLILKPCLLGRTTSLILKKSFDDICVCKDHLVAHCFAMPHSMSILGFICSTVYGHFDDFPDSLKCSYEHTCTYSFRKKCVQFCRCIAISEIFVYL